MRTAIKSVKDLKVYKIAYELATEISEITRKFPKEETSLVSRLALLYRLFYHFDAPNSVMPAEAGIHPCFRKDLLIGIWIPAFAGMTIELIWTAMK